MSILTITYWTHVEQICQLIFKNEKKKFNWKTNNNHWAYPWPQIGRGCPKNISKTLLFFYKISQ